MGPVAFTYITVTASVVGMRQPRNRGSILGSENIFSSPNLPHLFWIPSSLLFDECQELISRAKAAVA
jgi:hypothetical protein